jgi:hypothetical protein
MDVKTNSDTISKNYYSYPNVILKLRFSQQKYKQDYIRKDSLPKEGSLA